MNLLELREAIDLLILQDEEKKDENVHVEIAGVCYELKSISVIVASDMWIPDTIVATVEEVVAEGEEDGS